MKSQPSPNSHVAKVLIVEDNKFFRESLRRELSSFSKVVTVIGVCDNLGDARTFVGTKALDVVLLDLMVRQFPGDPEPKAIYGLSAIREIRHVAANVRVLVISQFSGRFADIVVSALELGAHGYIAKDDEFDGETIIRMIGRAVRGEPVFTPQIALVLLEHEIGSQFDAMERRVLEGMARGHSVEQIAEEQIVGLSEVIEHSKSILRKVHQAGRHQDVFKVAERFRDLL